MIGWGIIAITGFILANISILPFIILQIKKAVIYRKSEENARELCWLWEEYSKNGLCFARDLTEEQWEKKKQMQSEIDKRTEQRDMLCSKKDTIWGKLDKAENPCGTITAIMGAIVLVALLLLIAKGIKTKSEIIEFGHQKEMIEQTVENGTDLENIAITQTIIEYNQWLAKAKTNKEIYGIFSFYYGTDVDNMQPIMIKRE